jgi:choice-of-anchor C domain-containing protein
VVTDPGGFQFYYAGDNSIPGWTITGGSVDVLRAPRWQPHEGQQSVDLSGVTTGGIYQDVPTTPGQAYRLSFWLAGNPEFTNAGGGPAVKTMRLTWDGAPVANLSFDTTGRTTTDLGWTQYTFDIVATDATSRLWFESTTSGFAGPLIDDLNLVEVVPPAVPFPAAVFLGLGGAACVGVSRRGRRYHR